jgi:hypothetical protein
MKDNVIIAQSGTVYDSMCKQIEDNNIKLAQLVKNIDVMVKKNLEMSIQYEGCKRSNRDLRQENFKLQNVISTLAGYSKEHLEMFEQIFESDEASFKREDMIKYVTVAEYMEERYGRKTRYLRRVKDRLKDLPY